MVFWLWIQNKKIHLVGQERYAVSEYSWEFVSGGIKHKETPRQAALRELKEETGIKAGKISKILEFNTMNSLANRKVYMFHAKDLIISSSNMDTYEKIDLRIFSLDDIRKAVKKGKIKDAFSICALYAYLELQRKVKK